ncbi:sigma-70 family RNA polymerase sigma factor [Aeoliella sp.]|uniref:sigma-70 family RNA polymerase sigma factor n=1 Tax=Aeoliella sp. TaxID=2795800 RepID=UPI003CCBA4C3
MSTLEVPSEQSDQQERSARRSIAATDGELLLRFTRHQDESAFAQLVEAHGPLVWSVCRQVLHRQADIEDAFQATFLILASRAGDIRASDSAAGWLYRVAHRTAVSLARKNKSRPEEPLNGHDFAAADNNPLETVHRQHSINVLVEELRTLPVRFQEPLVLCYFEGHSRSRVAEMLDLTTATIKGRLARGKQMLRHRLARRGVALSVVAALAASTVESAKASAGETLAAGTASAATSYIHSGGATAGASSTACSLAQQGVSAMFFASLAKPALSVAALLAMGLVAAAASDDPPETSPSNSAPFGLVASADADFEASSDQTDVHIEVKATNSDDSNSPRRKPSVLDPDPQFTDPTDPSAPAEDSKRKEVQVEIVKSGDGSGEDILILRGDKVSVTDVQKILKKNESRRDQPPVAVEMHEMQVHTPDGDRTVRVPSIDLTMPAQPNLTWHQAADQGPSVEALELELKYWETRTQGLRMKAEGIEQQIERLQKLKDTGAIPAEELASATERVGDMMLLRADAYRAEARVLETKRKIELRKKQSNVPKATFVPAPQTRAWPIPHDLNSPQPVYAPQPAPADSAIPTPRYDVIVAPGAPQPQPPWFTNLDAATQQSQQSGRNMVVHFFSPYSPPCLKVLQMVQSTPSTNNYLHDHAIPVKVDVSQFPATAQRFKIQRIPTVCVISPDGQVLDEFVAPAEAEVYLKKLKAVVGEKRSAPSSFDENEADNDSPPETDSDEDHGEEVGEMLLPGEVVIVKISRQKPRSREDAYSIGINEGGYIGVPGANRTARIAGPLEKAAEKILTELRAFHGDYFDAMEVEVEVEPTGKAASRATLSSPMLSPLSRLTDGPPTVSGPYSMQPQNHASELEQLKEELEALRKENEELRKKTGRNRR